MRSRRDALTGLGDSLKSALLLAAGAGSSPAWAAPAASAAPATSTPGSPGEQRPGEWFADLPGHCTGPQDDDFWRSVARLYSVAADPINLEGGYWGVMARPVLHRYQAETARVNAENAMYARRRFQADAESVRLRLASALRVDPGEVALTRGATEALQLLITGYRRLRAGDRIVFADLDYDAMQYAMKSLQARRGAQVVKVNIPEPASLQAILDTYQQVLESRPHPRLLLLTHVSHRTGLVMPVKELAKMARQYGTDVILDAAHSWGQLDFSPLDLGVEFAGLNLHKWVGAPVGLGCMVIKRERLPDIDAAFGDEDWPADDIRCRVHTGTANFAATLTIPTALDVHERIGVQNKQARLKWLRDRWVKPLREVSGVQILTPDEDSLYCGITAFRLAGRHSPQANQAVVNALLDRYGVFTVRRAGLASGSCVRVTPSLYSTPDDVDRLAHGLQRLASDMA